MGKHQLPPQIANETITLERQDGTRREGLRARVRGNEIMVAEQDVAIQEADVIFRQFTNGITRRYEVTDVAVHPSLEATVLEVVDRGIATARDFHLPLDEDTYPTQNAPAEPGSGDGERQKGDLVADAFERCREGIEHLDAIDEDDRSQLLATVEELKGLTTGDAERDAIEDVYDRFVREAADFSALEVYLFPLAQRIVRSM